MLLWPAAVVLGASEARPDPFDPDQAGRRYPAMMSKAAYLRGKRLPAFKTPSSWRSPRAIFV
jgi:hypothetical protein